MTGVFSVVGFVAHLGAIERDMNELGPAIVARACEMVCAEAKRVLGKGYENWPPLAPQTLARKIGSGPLLETAELRASIEWHSHGIEGQVGSNNDKAVWHELGTGRIPPRSFLAGAAIQVGPKIEKMAARAVMAVLAGRGLHSAEMRELLHILKHVAHEVKETAAEIFDDTEEPDSRGRHR